MRLRYTSASPFVRKVMVTAHELGIQDQLELVPTALMTEDTQFWSENPLGKVPVLSTNEGQIYDSGVICEYLDATFGGGKLFHPVGEARWRCLTLAALANGIMEAGVTIRREGMVHGDSADKKLVAFETARMHRGLDRVQQELDALSAKEEHVFDYGAIATAVCLGWLEFRFGAELAFTNRPALEQWWQGVKTRASLTATQPK